MLFISRDESFVHSGGRAVLKIVSVTIRTVLLRVEQRPCITELFWPEELFSCCLAESLCVVELSLLAFS